MAHNIPKIQYKNLTTTGNISTGLATVTNIPSTTALVVGMVAKGTGVFVGAKILTIDGPTQVTLDHNSTATTVGLSIEFYVEIVFTYPPIEPKGEKIDPKERVSTSISGLRQVSIDFLEATRTLTFSFLTEAQKLLIETFFTSHAGYGNTFRYFDDQNSASYLTYELSPIKFDPAKITSKGANVYVWLVPFTFRRVI